MPSFLDNVFGVDPSEVHMHVRRIPLEEIPLSKDDAAAWLMNAFLLKDQLLTDFIVNGHFPQESTENQLSTVKCVANCIIVIVFTGIFTYLTFFSSLWFKVYVGLSLAYLVYATCFNFRPKPVTDSEETIYQRKTM
ncbi:UNVERIFIED_CONTAM: putative 1-acyl-sn-glycerol-3-phosphate acyltransferase 5 [Sesamum radiatum]|uniref:1-acylglycerol-3-phosphate O-acyltransferase n=1 Tax=Sesamum radiatum TaxID=300843 RepID=A0AAW2QE96_SESRA